MKILFAICSESVSVDRYTNKLSIFSVVDRLASTSFPFWMPRLCISLAVKREDVDPAVVHAKLVMLLDEKPIGTTSAILPFQPDWMARIVINTQLSVPAPGIVQFQLDTGTEQRMIAQITVQQISVADIPKQETQGIHPLTDTEEAAPL